ncbi:MAG: hypothetical protein AAGA33_04620 [Pseudomonadota bacterium]
MILLLGALPATVWSVLSLDVAWQTHWTVFAWLGALALWLAALAPRLIRSHPLLRLALALSLALGIFVAVFPMGFKLLFLVEYALSLSLLETLRAAGIVAALFVPIATACYCLVGLFRTRLQTG